MLESAKTSSTTRKNSALALAGIMLASGVLIVGTPTAQATNTNPLLFGVPYGDYSLAHDTDGIYLGLSSTNWMLQSDGPSFTDIDNALNTAIQYGATPVIEWYYWAGDASQYCVNTANACSGKSVAQWNTYAQNLAYEINRIMQGRTSIIVQETEFSGTDLAAPSYASTFDSMLKTQAGYFHAYANEKTIIGFANYGSGSWSQYSEFPQSVGASDILGAQMLRCADKHEANGQYVQSASDSISAAQTLYNDFGPGTSANKNSILFYDWGVSSYTPPGDAYNYETLQNAEIQKLRDNTSVLKSYDVIGFVWRDYRDEANRPTYYYCGIDERYFGFVREDTTLDAGTHKPSWQTFHDWSISENQATQPPTVPGAPQSLTATASSSSVTLQWQAPSSDGGAPITGYNVYRGTSTGMEMATPYATLGNVQQYTDTGVTSGNSYFYEVTAKNSVGESAKSNEAEATVQSSSNAGTSLFYEAENFQSKSTGQSFTCSSCSGGAAWNLWANGSISQPVSISAQQDVVVTIVAAGQMAGSAYPDMVLNVNGVKLAEWSVTSTNYWKYSARINIPAGTDTFQINFTNDYYGPLGDRNLLLDDMTIRLLPTMEWGAEAEGASFSCTAGVSTPDTSASGGAYWNLWSNGTCSSSFTTSISGNQEVRVYAKSNYVASEWAIMNVYVDHVLIGTYKVDTSNYGAYEALTNINAGAHTLKIQFTNDYLGTQGDRNLYLDKAEVWVTNTTASFTSPIGNAWWEQISVSSNKAISLVETRMNGGAWQSMTYHSTWGAWASGYNFPDGSTVDFRMTATDGTQVISSQYAWPPPTE